jgi:hypothetical protein
VDNEEEGDQASTEPATAAAMEIDTETLDELLTAWAVCVGATPPPPGGDTPDAMGMILTYLPAVLELARKQVDREGEMSRSAYPVSRSGN